MYLSLHSTSIGVQVQFQDLIVNGERVLQVLLITISDMADRPVERLAIEATVDFWHEPLKSLTRHEVRDNAIPFGLDLGSNFAGCRNHCIDTNTHAVCITSGATLNAFSYRPRPKRPPKRSML